MRPARRRDGSGPVRHAAWKRLRRACWIVGGLFAAAALAGVVGQLGRPSVFEEVALAAVESPSGIAGEFGSRAAPDAPALPLGFADEVLAVAGRDEARVDEQARVVGFSVAGADEDAFLSLADELEGNGWMRIESGSATCGSFSKSGGSYRWAFVSCVQVGEWTSVVVQYATTDEGS